MNSGEAREYMNWLGSKKEPFVFMIDFEIARPLVFRRDEAAANGLLFSFNGVGNFTSFQALRTSFRFTRQPVGFPEYKKAFDRVFRHLHEGNSYLVNLTFPTPIETDLTCTEILFGCPARYRLMLEGVCVVFSPETFITIRNRTISSHPMKGTIDASLKDAERLVLEDPKETAEHHTIVDLIRNDLSMVADSVRVKRFRYVERLTTNYKDLLQVSSEISGELPPNYHHRMGDILFTLLPAGSISGAPKKKTVEIIREAETGPRGYYTGVAGYFDGVGLDSTVLIRYLENTASGLLFRSGGGITVFSDPRKEYQELIDKVYVPVA